MQVDVWRLLTILLNSQSDNTLPMEPAAWGRGLNMLHNDKTAFEAFARLPSLGCLLCTRFLLCGKECGEVLRDGLFVLDETQCATIEAWSCEQ